MTSAVTLFQATSRRLKAYVTYARWDLGLSFVALLLWCAALILPAWRLLPQISAENIPLHYNVYLGVDRYGPWYYVFLPGFVGAGSWLVNLVLQILYIHRDRTLVRTLSIITVLIEVVLVVAVFFSTLLNI